MILSLLAIPQEDCLCANWAYVTCSYRGTKAYIDIDSIEVNNKEGEIKLWIKYLEKDGTFIFIYNSIDYKNKAFDILHSTEYDSFGNVTKSSTYKPSELKISIVPGGSLDGILDYVMKNKGLK